jgi:3-methylcrotonyl-CoA carboxylase alpha subunit
MGLFKKILIANRGEIAARIIKTASRLGIRTVAVLTQEDAGALHTELADESWLLKGDSLGETYLNIPQIIDLAKRSGVEAIHPGYGFLSENAEFAEACENHKLIFIGPSPDAIRLMGNKLSAGKFVKDLGIPVPEMIAGNKELLIRRVHSIDFPVLIKAAGGGGGKGMRILQSAEHLEDAILSTAREAKAYFGNEEIYLEKHIEKPRHIEVQILGDNHGNIIHLFERECSIQRRFQKIIEETPAVAVPGNIREKIRKNAVTIARAMNYRNAGTIEFLVDRNWDYYFLEMNTRLQVEHPVTEMTTGIDLVEQQIMIASGEPLNLVQEDIRQTGHAMECRIYAEDPESGFRPAPGQIILYSEPALDHVRVDSGISGTPAIISPRYDPLISKLIVTGKDRKEVLDLMDRALSSYVIHGVSNNISFLQALIRHPGFRSNNIGTTFCEEHLDEIMSRRGEEPGLSDYLLPMCFFLADQLSAGRNKRTANIWQEIGYWRQMVQIPVKYRSREINVHIQEQNRNGFVLETGGELTGITVHYSGNHHMDLEAGGRREKGIVSSGNDGKGWVTLDGQLFEFSRLDMLQEGHEYIGSGSGMKNESGKILSPMPGKVVEIRVKTDTAVTRGETLLVVEAMKMENILTAPFDGRVGPIHVREGQMVGNRETLMELIPPED